MLKLLEQFMYQPMDEMLRRQIVKKCAAAGYPVSMVEFYPHDDRLLVIFEDGTEAISLSL